VTDRPDLAALLADPARAVEVPAEAIASTLTEVGAQEGRLGTIKLILAARLAAPAPANNQHEHDVLVDDVHEVARIVRRSVSWVRKNGNTLPGFSQPNGKRCKVSWSRQALEAWVTKGRG